MRLRGTGRRHWSSFVHTPTSADTADGQLLARLPPLTQRAVVLFCGGGGALVAAEVVLTVKAAIDLNEAALEGVRAIG